MLHQRVISFISHDIQFISNHIYNTIFHDITIIYVIIIILNIIATYIFYLNFEII